MKHERPSNLNSYFGLFHGEAHTISELDQDVIPAIEILIFEGKAIEQRALDGDNLIYMPDAVKKNSNPHASSQTSQ